MEKKYLLYIDILGFSDIVKKDHMKVRRIFNIFDKLNLHKHHSFKVMIFSDTIIVFNSVDPLTDKHNEYIVMYMIEFVQDFLYRIIGKNIFFRAILIYDYFEYSRGDNFEGFFGNALIKSHNMEKNKKLGLFYGLFIDKHCQKYNRIFHTRSYSNDLSFVYLTQSLDSLIDGYLGDIPMDRVVLESLDFSWNLAEDIKILNDIYKNMFRFKDKELKNKYQKAWEFYYVRYGYILDELKKNNFNLGVICPDFDWSKANKRILEGYKGYGINAPTEKQMFNIITKAKNAGAKAAKEYIKINALDTEKLTFECGNATIILDIDARSKLGRFLLNISSKLKRVSISIINLGSEKGLAVSIYDMHDRQELNVDKVAHQAALKVLQEKLDIEGIVHCTYD
jgi:hypothetical protein